MGAQCCSNNEPQGEVAETYKRDALAEEAVAGQAKDLPQASSAKPEKAAPVPTPEVKTAESQPASASPKKLEEKAAAPPAAVPAAAEAQEETYTIVVDKKDHGRLGVDVNHQEDSKCLLIEAITGGCVGAWNEKHPQTSVNVGDFIVAVNGQAGDVPKMVEECKNSEKLEIKIKRG
eukprot:TRINITY_DN3275_c0_g1_i2.p2 TRINITY_DN3275_c0_g1~~TRINITY_DN3275_c0_g1_i2.p2  ORF type:complete len:200 (-),score=60.54 TRINITY_DN3275_c0_g1_i2:265-792(-)